MRTLEPRARKVPKKAISKLANSRKNYAEGMRKLSWSDEKLDHPMGCQVLGLLGDGMGSR
jgi:hypothetical protein